MLSKLNLGCGEEKKAGYINIDIRPLTKPDILHDLNKIPYPFLDNTFDIVEANHVLEHLNNVFLVMKEINRILKPGGRLILKVPHFSRGFTHAEHFHSFDVTFPLYFNEKFTKIGFSGVKFDLKEMKLQWLAFFHLMPSIGYGKLTILLLKGLSKVVSFLANLDPYFCSRIWCYWVGGFDQIEFQFICVK